MEKSTQKKIVTFDLHASASATSNSLTIQMQKFPGVSERTEKLAVIVWPSKDGIDKFVNWIETNGGEIYNYGEDFKNINYAVTILNPIPIISSPEKWRDDHFLKDLYSPDLILKFLTKPGFENQDDFESYLMSGSSYKKYNLLNILSHKISWKELERKKHHSPRIPIKCLFEEIREFEDSCDDNKDSAILAFLNGLHKNKQDSPTLAQKPIQSKTENMDHDKSEKVTISPSTSKRCIFAQFPSKSSCTKISFEETICPIPLDKRGRIIRGTKKKKENPPPNVWLGDDNSTIDNEAKLYHHEEKKEPKGEAKHFTSEFRCKFRKKISNRPKFHSPKSPWIFDEISEGSDNEEIITSGKRRDDD